MKIKPLFDRVVLKPIKEKSDKIGNIILPESSKQPEISEVIALGTGNVDGKEVVFEVDIGDKVLFNKFSGYEFVIDGEVYIIIKEKDILGIVEKK